jgi:hypothetical protein
MKPTAPLVSEVTSLRVTERSADGQKITIGLTTRYIPERFYAVPLDCLSDLIAELERLKGSEAAPTAAATDEAIFDTEPATPASPPPAPDAAASDPNEIKVRVPKKWMLASALPHRPMVIVMFDPQTDQQTAFGLGASAARDMATGLIKQADAIVQHAEKSSKS